MTVVMVAVVVCSALVSLLIAAASSVAVARTHASAAADAAALAASSALANGDGCSSAVVSASVAAQANNTHVEDFQCFGFDATVTVAMHFDRFGITTLHAQAHATADFSRASP